MSSKTAPKKTAPKSTSPKDEGSVFSVGNAVGIVLVLAICVVALWGVFGRGNERTGARPVTPEELARRNAASPAAAAPVPALPRSQPPTRTGQPWEYDAATNHHWDPRQGHQHWHQGPPPPADQRAEPSQPTITPITPGADGSMPMDASQLQVDPIGPDRQGSPWEYDAGTDAHWDPRPGHEHWHRGQPPAEDQRQ